MSAIIIHETPQSEIIKRSVDMYLQSISSRLSPRTAKAYSRHINDFKRWFIDTPMVLDLKHHLQDYRAHLIGRYESAKSINLALSTVRSLYKFLYESGLIDHDPTVSLKNIAESEGLRRAALSREQLAIIIHHLNTSTKRQAKRDRVMFLLLVMTGIRRNELVNIKIEDIGIENGRRCVYLLRKGYIDKSTFVILKDEVYLMLMDFIGDKISGYVFNGERTGDRLSPDTISRLVKKLFRDCGYDAKQLSLHSTRHTYAILALDGGASMISLSKSMNHKNISTTANYTRSYDRITNAAEDAVSLDFNA